MHGEGSALISVDPNIRPALADGPVGATLGNSAAVVRERLDRLIGRADVVKVSAEDLEWLEPDVRGETWTPPRSAGPSAAPRWSCSPTAAPAPDRPSWPPAAAPASPRG